MFFWSFHDTWRVVLIPERVSFQQLIIFSNINFDFLCDNLQDQKHVNNCRNKHCAAFGRLVESWWMCVCCSLMGCVYIFICTLCLFRLPVCVNLCLYLCVNGEQSTLPHKQLHTGAAELFVFCPTRVWRWWRLKTHLTKIFTVFTEQIHCLL